MFCFAFSKRMHAAVLILAVLLLLTACSGGAPAANQAVPTQPPATPSVPGETHPPITTEAPPPTDAPAASAIPTSETSPSETPAANPGCAAEGMPVYTSPQGDYCFAYPEQFSLDPSPAAGTASLSSPALDQSLEPLKATLGIEVQPVSEEADLARLVDAYLAQTSFQGLPAPIERTQIILGGEPAEVLEDVPGLLSSRLVMALHKGSLYTLRFHPSDAAQAEADLEALYEALTSSFRFLPGAASHPAGAPYDLAWVEFEHVIQITLDPSLALWVDTATVPPVPVDPSTLFAESHPATVQFRFLGYLGGRLFQLPYPLTEPRLTIYATKDFPGFGDDMPIGFPQTLERLRSLLADRPELHTCDALPESSDPILPFLPWLNSSQVFCARPEYVEFNGGQGIRYLTAFSQDLGPTLDTNIFYTFQGLSDDGEIYLSAVFPVRTGVFPTQPDPNFDMARWQEVLQGQLEQIQAASDDSFEPSLDELDGLVNGFTVRKQ